MNFIRPYLTKPTSGIPRRGAAVLLSLMVATGSISASAADSFRARWHQLQSSRLTQQDIQTEMRFGQEVAARILAAQSLLQNPSLTRYVNLVGSSLAMHGNRSELPYYFAILDSTELAAYSAPGGYVFITSGLLTLAENEAELAAILAHEVAHINLMHIVEDLDIRATGREELSGLARFIGASGTTTQVAFNQAVDKAMAYLFTDGFKKSQELDADRRALELMALTGYDPAALKQILQRIRLQSGSKAGRTHPDFSQRQQRLDAFLQQTDLQNSVFNLNQERFTQLLSRK